MFRFYAASPARPNLSQNKLVVILDVLDGIIISYYLFKGNPSTPIPEPLEGATSRMLCFAVLCFALLCLA